MQETKDEGKERIEMRTRSCVDPSDYGQKPRIIKFGTHHGSYGRSASYLRKEASSRQHSTTRIMTDYGTCMARSSRPFILSA